MFFRHICTLKILTLSNSQVLWIFIHLTYYSSYYPHTHTCMNIKFMTFLLYYRKVSILFFWNLNTILINYSANNFLIKIFLNFSPGYGQLTQRGIERAYEFGKFLRQRYNESFLDEHYSPTKVVVRSTNYDRTLMTADSILAGLFPSIDFQKWSDRLDWQPIPVHTTEGANDKVEIRFFWRFSSLRPLGFCLTCFFICYNLWW